jgi:hypothetical protein
MAELKLARLPDRTPVKINIVVTPALNQKLGAYAEAYKSAYGEEEEIADLIPFMLDQFLAGDRNFRRARRARG